MTETAAACAIVKDERAYLIEWVAWYRLLGFDRIVLYSNDCGDGSAELLDAMAAHGLVAHRRWPSIHGRSPQGTAYRDALDRADADWTLFVDADEFLHLDGDETIGAFLRRFGADVSAVALSWRLFGSAGLAERGPEPVIARFDRAAPAGHPNNRHVKTIARSSTIVNVNPHGGELTRGRYVDAEGRDVALHRKSFMPPLHRVAWVNHYVVKSRAEFEDKRRRGNAHLAHGDPAKYAARDDDFFAVRDRNDEEDRRIQRRLPALAAEMARIAAIVGEAPLRPPPAPASR